MLDKKTFKQGINNLIYSYPLWRIDVSNVECMKFWYDNFNNFDNDSFIEGINTFVRNNKEYPTISELRNVIIKSQRYIG
jgi:hypothetical protein